MRLPPRTRRTTGRPRVQGQKLASPQEVVAHTAKRNSLMVAWYGGTIRDIEVVTGTGHWHRIGGGSWQSVGCTSMTVQRPIATSIS
jgi:hypothetical protein